MQDGDNIRAVILGSAVNNDGHTMGLTVPSQEGQKEVISQALKKSGVTPESISYLEAHGTGTLLGDPIEIRAASQVYQDTAGKTQYCAVGSVKSNIGHLIRAAGVASFIKVALALENKIIPPTLNCLEPHPRFKFESSPFYPVREVRQWRTQGNMRRAAISSFGFGGTNCHMILDEFQCNEVENYMLVRTALPLNTFRRNYFCIGKEIKSEIKESELQEDEILKILEGLKSGDVSLEDAMALIGN
nr:polyketide synthase [Ruminiclostridium josui]